MAAVRVRLLDAGLDEVVAEEFAVGLVAAIEGGFVLSRTARDAELLRATGRRMARALAFELERATQRVEGA